ncbi:MAG TPA: hypothetical protein VIH50_02375 [Steroidobacteraceae bacterium]|jgi:hypothetical protein
MMNTRVKYLIALVAAALTVHVAHAADAAPCTGFKWDVSHEVALMQGTAQPLVAAPKAGSGVPQVNIDVLYSARLLDQAGVSFAATPGKNSHTAGARAGLVRFRVKSAGRYRISITGNHWIDIVSDGQLVPSVDFQGHADCERPRKIVEFDLPADKPLVLQFSGSSDPSVTFAITAANAAR